MPQLLTSLAVWAVFLHPFKKLQQGGNVDSGKGIAYRSILLNKNHGRFHVRVLPVGAFPCGSAPQTLSFQHTRLVHLPSLTPHRLSSPSQLGLMSSLSVLPFKILIHILGTDSPIELLS